VLAAAMPFPFMPTKLADGLELEVFYVNRAGFPRLSFLHDAPRVSRKLAKRCGFPAPLISPITF